MVDRCTQNYVEHIYQTDKTEKVYKTEGETESCVE